MRFKFTHQRQYWRTTDIPGPFSALFCAEIVEEASLSNVGQTLRNTFPNVLTKCNNENTGGRTKFTGGLSAVGCSTAALNDKADFDWRVPCVAKLANVKAFSEFIDWARSKNNKNLEAISKPCSNQQAVNHDNFSNAPRHNFISSASASRRNSAKAWMVASGNETSGHHLKSATSYALLVRGDV